MPQRLNQWAPKQIVKVTFGRDPETGEVDHLAPFVASDRAGLHSAVYEDEPPVVVEMEADTGVAYFEAQWIQERWVFGHRVLDKDW